MRGVPSFDTSLAKGFGASAVVLTRSIASPTRLQRTAKPISHLGSTR